MDERKQILENGELDRLVKLAAHTGDSLNFLLYQALLASRPEVAKAFAIRCGIPS